jgi:hypothetical protein
VDRQRRRSIRRTGRRSDARHRRFVGGSIVWS